MALTAVTVSIKICSQVCLVAATLRINKSKSIRTPPKLPSVLMLIGRLRQLLLTLRMMMIAALPMSAASKNLFPSKSIFLRVIMTPTPQRLKLRQPAPLMSQLLMSPALKAVKWLMISNKATKLWSPM
jgi:hypothetical protein